MTKCDLCHRPALFAFGPTRWFAGPAFLCAGCCGIIQRDPDTRQFIYDLPAGNRLAALADEAARSRPAAGYKRKARL